MSNCNTCPSSSTCTEDKEECMIENNPMNRVKKIIGVMSGKGGVGKSTISVLIAKQLNHLGNKVGILDADITGPSIPRLLGIKDEKARSSDGLIFPVKTKDGIKVMSLNLLLEDENQPVIWRGPLIAGTVKQFWTDVLWGDLDYLIIDLPPGTGDVALTVLQSIPISGLVVVSVPQDFVSMIVSKAVNMARKMNIKVLGVVENMSYIICPNCNKKIRLFADDNIDNFLVDMKLDFLGELPMLSNISNLSNHSYENLNEEIQLIFKPILTKVINKLEED